MEQQWNTEMPPAGEAGMCVTQLHDGESRKLQVWNGAVFCMVGRSGDEAWCVRNHGPSCVQAGISWRWATLADPGVTAEMLHSSQREAAAPKRDADPYTEARVAFADRELQTRLGAHAQWGDYCQALPPNYLLPPECYRRRPKLEPAQAQAEPVAACQGVDPDHDQPMKDRDAIQKAITEPAKDEGWREYDPKYPPIQPYPMEFRVVEGEGESKRFYYRRTDTPDIELPTWLCVAPVGQRVGGGRWGL